jgi:hypothetical protein
VFTLPKGPRSTAATDRQMDACIPLQDTWRGHITVVPSYQNLTMWSWDSICKSKWETVHTITGQCPSKEARSAIRQWFTSVILATQEAEIRRITVQSQPRQIVHKTLSRKNSIQKRAGAVAQGGGTEFKPQYQKKKKKKKGVGEGRSQEELPQTRRLSPSGPLWHTP